MNRPIASIALSLLALATLSGGVASAQRSAFGIHAQYYPHGGSHPIRARVRLLPAPPHCAPLWIPGRYEQIEHQVWVPARERRVWIEPVFETRCDLWGRTHKRLIAPGHWQVVHEPGHYQKRSQRVWRPGHYQARF